MRIMLDTNILVSMIFFPSQATAAFRKVICKNHTIILCDYVLEELRLVTQRKFPSRIMKLNQFFHEFPFEFLYVPREWKDGNVPEIRDMKDSPILAAALMENVDVFVTGDKDFTTLVIDTPKIMTMTDFTNEYGTSRE